MNEDYKKVDQKKSERVSQYYQQPGFLAWVTDNNFSGITADNVQRYFMVFQHVEMCREKLCHDCAGMAQSWDTEAEIQSGLIKHHKCPYQEQKNRELLAKQMAERSPIPKAFRNTNFEDLKSITIDVVEQIKSYIQLFPANNPTGLYLHSSVHGIGRTSLMWVIVRELILRGKLLRGFVFHTTSMFIDKLQTDMFTQEHLFMNKSLNCDLLLLDDFGREKATDWSSAKIEGLLEERTWNKRPCILSSVIPPDDWAWQNPQEKSLMSKIRKAAQPINLYTNEDGNERA